LTTIKEFNLRVRVLGAFEFHSQIDLTFSRLLFKDRQNLRADVS
jgi:hypothetical protein